MKLTLPIDSTERKGVPVYTGCLMYFPAALAGVAAHSKAGNDKHNPGQELHHSRGKSNDHADCVVRHVMDIGDMLAYLERNCDAGEPDPEVVKALLTEANANSWRSLALSQELYERFGGAPLAPRARLGAPVADARKECGADCNFHPTVRELPTFKAPIAAAFCEYDGCYNNVAPRGGSYCVAHIPTAL